MNTKISFQANKSKIKLTHQQNDAVPLTTYHQDARGLRGKANEFLSQLYLTFPNILCLTERHMNHLELQQTFLESYNLGVSYCRTLYEKEGVCIFMQESLRYESIDLEKYCKDKDFEVCAIKIYLNTKTACIIAIYSNPSGNFDLFITKLDTILRELYTSALEYIICGGININYLVDSDRKSQFEALLKTYNLISVVNFPTHTQQNSATAINNIFIDITRMGNYSICPITNGLSVHDAQSRTLHFFNLRPPTKNIC